jgi:hypothetical protein
MNFRRSGRHKNQEKKFLYNKTIDIFSFFCLATIRKPKRKGKIPAKIIRKEKQKQVFFAFQELEMKKE